MSVQNINGSGNITPIKVQYAKQEENNAQDTIQKEKKNGKKKLALALAGLAAVGIAAIVIANGKKPASIDGEKTRNGLNEALNAGKEKIKALVKKEDLPFDNSTKTILDGKGKIFAAKDTISKYTAQYNGKDVIVEQKLISAENLHKHNNGQYAFIRDAKTGKILDVKRLTLEGNEILASSKTPAKKNVLKTIEKTANENGNKIVKTYKNGKLYSTQTTVLNPDNSKQIIVEYAYDKGYKKIIDIAADGTRKITKEGRPMFSL